MYSLFTHRYVVQYIILTIRQPQILVVPLIFTLSKCFNYPTYYIVNTANSEQQYILYVCMCVYIFAVGHLQDQADLCNVHRSWLFVIRRAICSRLYSYFYIPNLLCYDLYVICVNSRTTEHNHRLSSCRLSINSLV